MKTTIGFSLAVWLIAVTGFSQQTWHVSTNGSDANTGKDWSQAWASISNAMTNAAANDTILVSNGVYVVTEPILVDKAVTISGYPPNTNSIVTKEASGYFRLFVVTHTDAVIEYLAITNGNANSSIGIWQTGGGGAINMTGGTVRHCLVANNTFAAWGVGGGIHASGSSTISNCVIRGNTTPKGSYAAGVGIYNNGANVRVADCDFIDNGWGDGQGAGGGLYMAAGIVERCRFLHNRGTGGGGGVYMTGGTVSGCYMGDGNSALYNYGGGVYVSGGVVSNCIMQGGTARGGGSGAYVKSTGLIVDSVITNNTPVAWSCYYGAGLYMDGGAVVNTLIADNVLPDYASDGGGVYMKGGRLLSCTIVSNKNTATHVTGGGTLLGGGIYRVDGAITNCIIYGNSTAMADDDDNLAGPDVTNACWYSCSPGLVNTENFNITNNPLLAEDGSYRLQSKAGRWTPSGWVTDAQHSPCIDQGPPDWEFSREPAYNGGRINMGFDANTLYASKSLAPRPAGTVLLIR